MRMRRCERNQSDGREKARRTKTTRGEFWNYGIQVNPMWQRMMSDWNFEFESTKGEKSQRWKNICVHRWSRATQPCWLQRMRRFIVNWIKIALVYRTIHLILNRFSLSFLLVFSILFLFLWVSFVVFHSPLFFFSLCVIVLLSMCCCHDFCLLSILRSNYECMAVSNSVQLYSVVWALFHSSKCVSPTKHSISIYQLINFHPVCLHSVCFVLWHGRSFHGGGSIGPFKSMKRIVRKLIHQPHQWDL